MYLTFKTTSSKKFSFVSKGEACASTSKPLIERNPNLLREVRHVPHPKPQVQNFRIIHKG